MMIKRWLVPITTIFMLLTGSAHSFITNDPVLDQAYSKGAYDTATNKLFLGADAANDENSLMSAKLNQKADGTYEIAPVALAPATATVNGVATTPNPLNNKIITHVTLMGGKPVVTLPMANAPGKVFLVNNTDNGSEIFQNTETNKIKDAGGANVTHEIPAIAANDTFIVAAVPATTRTWQAADGLNRGFAVLKKDNQKKPTKLITQEAKNGGDGNLAKLLDLTTTLNLVTPTATDDNPVAFRGPGAGAALATAKIGAAVDMYYSPHVKRFFIGLSEVSKNVDNANGGVVSVLVGDVDTTTGQLTLQPILEEASAGLLPTADVNNQVIGFYNAGANHVATASKVRTMQTKTGYTYLLVVGGVKPPIDALNTPLPTSWVTALPIISDETSGYAGQLAKASDHQTIATVAIDLVKINRKHSTLFPAAPGWTTVFAATEIPYVVGADPRLIGGELTNKTINDINVIGETVYVSVAEDRDVTNDGAGKLTGKKEAGIFKSTAILDAYGKLAAWTPWERVGLNTEKVFNFGFDQTTGNFIGVTTADMKTIASSAWGKSNKVTLDPAKDRKLSTVLDEEFTRGGVYTIVTLNEYTLSFAKKDNEFFSMMVGLGYNQVAAIQTSTNGLANNVLMPTTVFKTATPDNTVKIFKDTDNTTLTDICPLTCADALRKPLLDGTNDGYLFVGGWQGLARLEKDDTTGWNTEIAEGLKNITTFDTPAADTFKFQPFSEATDGTQWGTDSVVAVQGAGSYIGHANIFALGFKKLAEINFNTGAIVGAPLVFAPTQGYGLDMLLIANKKLIVATTKGLFVTPDAATALTQNLVNADGTSMIDGAPVQLLYVSSDKTVTSATGNLYVFAINYDTNTGKIYRFFVDTAAANADVITPIEDKNGEDASLMFDLGAYRHYIGTDGSVFFDSQSKTLYQDKLLNMRTLNNDAAISSPITALLEATANKQDNVGFPVRDSASGAWVFPGHWGVRVNE